MGAGATPSQALAWLLQKSPVVLPIPGTDRTWSAARLTLSAEDMTRLDALA